MCSESLEGKTVILLVQCESRVAEVPDASPQSKAAFRAKDRGTLKSAQCDNLKFKYESCTQVDIVLELWLTPATVRRHPPATSRLFCDASEARR